ncbi:MAG: hypothetical protein U0670_02650 [Anaerolineae bacterium]
MPPHDDQPTPEESSTESQVRLDLRMKTQQVLLARLLPAMLASIDEVTDFMFEPDLDDEDIHHHLRELATETIIDEVVRLLTRDSHAVSRQYTVQGEDGIAFDTLIASYGELLPERVQGWFARMLNVDQPTYQQLASSLPEHMPL